MAYNVTVIGATGLVGSKLVKQLIECDQIKHINILVRRNVEFHHAKITCHRINFDELVQHHTLINGDMLFSCLGTTKRQAGSINAQRIVDVDYQYTVAKIAAENGVGRYILVSSSGANSKSVSAYLKMKGELETKIKALPFNHISILQPSLLLGNRDTFRLGEYMASLILPTLCKFAFLKRFKPITASQVATKMLDVSLNQTSPLAIYSLDQLFELHKD
ncbi:MULTISPECIES: NAD(P)H-binding protein [Pseudoalteromonas]|uniref:NAD(P)H-binding protein n=1 Tax=Pseudoalteromonas TaxID=53246 RepID=UPI00026CCD56|nr:NAD(P)H-binding protein [Pseudoalteromonas spongiae]ATD01117.1 hypothetical protein PSPO_b1221 [Pseudoalteromonas spongiae UST010723-006]